VLLLQKVNPHRRDRSARDDDDARCSDPLRLRQERRRSRRRRTSVTATTTRPGTRCGTAAADAWRRAEVGWGVGGGGGVLGPRRDTAGWILGFCSG
jgi:hypothetical protein